VGVNGGGNIIGHWDGSGWARVASNDPNATFLDVAAISPTDAWAVGFYGDPQGRFNTARVLHWDGMTWAHYPAPPGGSYAFLYGVSADSATDVWAVGWWDASNGSIHPLVLHFDGTAWTQVPAVSPTGGDEFESVAALAPDDVWAVGSRQPSFAEFQPLIEHWDGTAWSVVPGPYLNGDTNILYGVSGSSFG